MRHMARLVGLLALVTMAACSPSKTGDPPAGDGAAPVVDLGASPDGPVSSTPDPLSVQELKRVVSTLASDELEGRDEGTPGGAKARTFIINELKRCGVAPGGVDGTFEQKVATGKGTNVLGLIKGTGAAESKRVVLISAHYDHLGVCGGEICNGAYDNASSVTIVLGVACALAHSPLKRTVMIASWDAEEPPTFLTDAMGSAFYVANPLVPLADVDVSIVLDLLGVDPFKGFPGHFALGAELSPQITAAVDTVKSPPGLQPLRLGLHLAEQTALGFQPWSDYHNFRNAKVPTLFITDGYNKNYHKPTDEVSLLDIPRMAREARYLLALVEQLGNTPASSYLATSFVEKGADYLTDAVNVEQVIGAALGKGGLAEGLTATSQQKMKGDLVKVQTVKSKLTSGGTADPQDVTALRTAVQRLMCYTGPLYTESMCNLF
jgi:hypothetical protein